MADTPGLSPVAALISGSSGIPDYKSVVSDNIWGDFLGQQGQQRPLVQQLAAFQPVQPRIPTFARQAAATFGGGGGMQNLGGNLSPAEAWIIQHESGGDVNARNKSSGAFGLGQLNPSSGTLQGIAKELGYNPYTTDYGQQLAMFRQYVKERYGTADNAERFWQAHGWY